LEHQQEIAKFECGFAAEKAKIIDDYESKIQFLTKQYETKLVELSNLKESEKES
jgi:cupin superfamily acireductone dioxygenase involved in methionine salvage